MPKYIPIRERNIYDPKSAAPFKLSRTKVEDFLACPKCFYLDRRLGLNRPSIPGFTLNDAVDHLLKKEFDLLRENGQKHELMHIYEIDAIPFKHKDIDIWRDNFKGFEHHHKKTNLILTGAIDDVWVNSQEELHIVDYKATSTTKEISLEDEYKQGYKLQIEFYQWLFRQEGYKVSDVGYFIFANGSKNNPKFDGKLEFGLSIIIHKGNSSWVEPTIQKIKNCLDSNNIPESNPDCEFCQYRSAEQELETKND